LVERKSYSTKDQSQAEEILSQQQLKSPLGEILSQAEKAYMAYMEAERQVARAYHENEVQVAKAYKRAEQKAQRTYDEAVIDALRIREETATKALDAYREALEMAEAAFGEAKEQADKTCDEIIVKALKAREDAMAEAWDTCQQAMLSTWKIFSSLTDLGRIKMPTEDEIFLQKVASAFKEELEQPISADHFSAVEHASRYPTNENIETAKRMLRAQRKAADIRSKD